MVKKIYSYLLLLAILVACSDDQVGIVNYTRKIDMSASTLSDYQNDAALMYSTDGGKTFVGFPKLQIGQTYQTKVVYNPDPSTYTFPGDGSIAEISVCPFSIDWSASNPKPTTVDNATGIATFVADGNSSIMVTVTNIPFSADAAVGTYEVVTDDWQDYSPGDHLTVQKVDDTHIKIVEYPGTGYNHAGLVISVASTGAATVASQDNGSYNSSGTQETTTTGTGTVSSCGGTIDLTLKFTLPCCGSFSGNALSLKKI